MKKSLARIIHAFWPKACLKHVLDETAWQGHELYCPVCGRLVAYATPFRGYYSLHVTYRYTDYHVSIYASSPQWMDEPVPKEEPVTIDWDLLRSPIEPLLSDTWDDEKSYQQCVQDYILQKHAAEEIQNNSPPLKADAAE